MKILVTGITGYVGSTLAPRLREEGHEVVGLSRNPAKGTLEIPTFKADISTNEGLDRALDGVEVAYYLTHSYESSNPEGFAVRDKRMAHNFARAARAAGVRRVVHLGVFDVDSPEQRSAHQRSRMEVDQIVRQATPESTTLRASAVIGASNWYFKTLVNMARRLPVVVLPKRGRLRLQPIDERDVVECLAAAAISPRVAGRAVDIAGPDVVTQAQFMKLLRRALGKPPLVVGVPVSMPRAFAWLFATIGHGDPALLKPLFYTGLADNVAHEDGALLLGVKTHSLAESLARAVAGGEPSL
jgi:uncharacterized protein YbjT (DUF2867 family)